MPKYNRQVLDYERSVFSQNGEDGILEYLIKFTNKKTFVEIGWGEGITNNCKNLLVNNGFTGTGVDRMQGDFKHKRLTVAVRNLVSSDTSYIINLQGESPGVFSIDIDSIDYYLLSNLIKASFRPDIIVHEYNSIWGPKATKVRQLKAPTDKCFHYGASLQSYKNLLSPFYTFVTVDTNGVNAFWIRSDINFTMPSQRLDFVRISNRYKAGKYSDEHHMSKNDGRWDDINLG